jgi:hypothetical protein
LGCDNHWAVQGITCGLAPSRRLRSYQRNTQGSALTGFDALKGDNTCDEGQQIHVDPLHSYVPKWVPDLEIYGPGIHAKGHWDIAATVRQVVYERPASSDR